jgi:hypothetical protein
MGSEVDRVRPQYIDNVLAQLRTMSRFAEGQSDRHALLTIRKELFDSKDFRRARREYLKIYIAGFLYLDQSTKIPYYQFFAESRESPETSGRNYVLDYQWPSGVTFGNSRGEDAEKRAAAFIDSMFLVMRQHQSPWSPTDLLPSGRQCFGIAEYLFHLPRLSANDAALRVIGETRSLADDFGWHYVPYGELVFFTLAWRYCLRQAASSMSPDQSLWREDKRDRNSFEGELSQWLHNPNDELKLETREAIKVGLSQVDTWDKGFDNLFLWDLYNLLIIDSPAWRGKLGIGVQPLLRYLSSADAFPQAIRLEASDRLQSHGTMLEYGPEDVRGLDQFFRTAVAAFLEALSGSVGEVGTDTSSIHLKILHGQSS